jgi:four helix bundle protein
MKESILKDKSFKFAVNSVLQYKKLVSNSEFVLSKQFLRSATSVGANIREANNAQSIADFVHKLNISQKECDESRYWLELLHESNYMESFDFSKLHFEATEILKILKSSINTCKEKMKNKS